MDNLNDLIDLTVGNIDSQWRSGILEWIAKEHPKKVDAIQDLEQSINKAIYQNDAMGLRRILERYEALCLKLAEGFKAEPGQGNFFQGG